MDDRLPRLVKGGQGRSAHDLVEGIGYWLVLALILSSLLVLLLVL